MLLVALVFPGQADARQPGAAADASIETAPVELDGVVLFRVRGVSSYPADTRARAIRNHLREVAADAAIGLDAFHIVDSEGMTQIMARDRLVMTLVDADALLEQVNRVALATAHMRRMQQAVVDYRAARTPAALWRATGMSAAATLALLIAAVVIMWLWRRVDRYLTSRLEKRIATVGIQSFEVMRAERIRGAIRAAFIAVRTVAFLALGLTYLTYVLAQLPWSRGLSRDVVTLAVGPLETMAQGFIDHVPSLVFLVILFLVVRFTLRLVRLFFEAVGQGSVAFQNFDPEWAGPTYKILRIVVIAFALIVAYPYIPGADTAAFKGVSLFIGIVFSLGSSTAISNIIAGYMLTYRRAMKVGDRVQIGDALGEVLETRLQVTHLRSFKNEEIIIPNSQILGSEVRNYTSMSKTRGLIMHTEVGIGYETPWRQVEAMLIDAAGRTEGVLKEPRPFVLQKKLGDFAVTYEINAYTNDVGRLPHLYSDLHRNILDVFNEYGVQIMTPAYEGDPEIPKVVPPKDWFTAPATPPRAGS
jgi:small-conductance mechanosensitive channel